MRPNPARPIPDRVPAAIAGALAAGVAVATSELIAGLVPGTPSLVVAVGDLAIELQPPGAKDVMVGLFGTADKLALNLTVVAAVVAIGAVAGIVASRRPVAGGAIFVLFGAVSAVVAAGRPLISPGAAIASATLAVIAGLVALRALLSLAPPTASSRPAASSPVADPSRPSSGAEGPEWARRRFLIVSAGTLGGVAVAGALGRSLFDAHRADAVVTSSRLPAAFDPVPALTSDEVIGVPGVTPLVVPNADFYRIDTTLADPPVDLAAWRLEVKGMVDHPLTFTYDELLNMPLYEQYVTIACVSNRVGGHLVGNALWTGVRLKEVLGAAGVQAGATQVVGRSVDGFTVGFPTAWAMAPEREPFIAVGMDRQPLPAAHGFPARLIVPGLYGYVSATKWLASIELTTREAVDGFWIPLGWAKDGPILTQSRIDVPQDGDRLAAGPIEIAGVAWAPDRGVEGVQVRIDDGAWQPAQVSRPISKATWVQWAMSWTPPPGHHTIEVQAIDGTGTVQTDQVSEPAPDGARGHHRITVDVG